MPPLPPRLLLQADETTTDPLAPDAVVPLLSTTRPVAPDAEAKPEASASAALTPDTTLPLLNTSEPDAPSESEPPEATFAPPEASLDEPELSTIAPVRDDPTLDTSVSDPDEPEKVVPELKIRAPLEPSDSAFALRITMPPELDDAPAPLTTDTTPPTPAVAVVDPARRTTLPPSPEPETPAVMDTAPARPAVAPPLPITTQPDVPDAVAPDCMDNDPEEPLLPTAPDATSTEPELPDCDVPD
jgi:hypothetical protein